MYNFFTIGFGRPRVLGGAFVSGRYREFIGLRVPNYRRHFAKA
jgi:hypothetical protein